MDLLLMWGSSAIKQQLFWRNKNNTQPLDTKALFCSTACAFFKLNALLRQCQQNVSFMIHIKVTYSDGWLNI